MVMPEVVTKIFLEFYRDYTIKNVVKLLFRGKQLYEARAEAIKILKLVTEIDQSAKPESLIWRLLQDDGKESLPKERKAILNSLVQLVSRALTTVTCFQTSHNNYKREFVFRK